MRPGRIQRGLLINHGCCLTGRVIVTPPGEKQTALNYRLTTNATTADMQRKQPFSVAICQQQPDAADDAGFGESDGH